MKNQLEMVAKSYDRGIDLGRKGIDLYKNLPEVITSDPDYIKYKAELECGSEGSGAKEISEYLLPNSNMKFVDLGCCLNLMFRGYDKWPSEYYGVDISSETIKLLNEYVEKNKLPIGPLYCGSIHETPFDDNYFDIAACIGVLEYFEKDYVEKAIKEAHRIIKPNGKLVLDIPNIESITGKMMMKIEEYMGRPDKFNMLPKEFESIIKNYFEIEKTDGNNGDAMGIGYYLKCKK
jgi:ubiquinone/menaquinone biosynthesis C-methylase UbiE